MAHKEKYIIGTRQNHSSNYSVSRSPVVHANEISANMEAERLAGLNPDKEFVVMKMVKAFRSSTVVEVDV